MGRRVERIHHAAEGQASQSHSALIQERSTAHAEWALEAGTEWVVHRFIRDSFMFMMALITTVAAACSLGLP